MMLTYAFVFYFTIVIACLNVGLVIFVFRGTRRLVFNFLKKSNLGDNQIILSIVYVCYAIIFVILADSIWTYVFLRSAMQLEHGAPLLNDFDVFERSIGKRDYMSMFKREREFYMAERNFMLTASALIVSFMYHKFVAAISKLNDLENSIEAEDKLKTN